MGEECQAGYMISFKGELPPAWRSRWEELKAKANRSFDWMREDSELERVFDKHVYDKGLKALMPVIKGLTRILPSDRLPAAEALRRVQQLRSELVSSDSDSDESAPEGSDNIFECVN